MCKEPWETVGQTKYLFQSGGPCSVQPLLRSQLPPVFSMLGYLLLSLSGFLLPFLQGRSFSCIVLGLYLTLKAFCPNFGC